MAVEIEARDLRGLRDHVIAEAAPLPAPWTMFIEPTNSCNFRCLYCPTGDPALVKSVGRRNKLMDYGLFTKIIGELKQFPKKLRMLNLYKDGESLLHPRFCDMVQYAKNAGISEKIWVKTNGSLFTSEYNERLVNCGLDMIGISVQHVHAQGFYDIAGVRVDYEEYRNNVKDLFQRSKGTSTRISAKIADVGLSESDKNRFIDDFSDRCDFIAIEGLHGWSASDVTDWKLGTNKSFDGTPRTNKIACPLVMYMLTINANGDVSICNDDWMHAHEIGDAWTQTIPEIWASPKLREFRMMHLDGRRHENRACRDCDYMTVLPDNIDNDLEELKGKI